MMTLLVIIEILDMKNKVLKNIIAFILGVFIGGAINMGIIMVSGTLIPPPEGADVTTMEGLKASMHLFEPKHFLMPFLAHALGTFFGALLVAKFAVNHKMKLALGVGFFFLAGGIANTFMLPSPIWFTCVDLIGAYLPIAFIAGKLIVKNR